MLSIWRPRLMLATSARTRAPASRTTYSTVCRRGPAIKSLVGRPPRSAADALVGLCGTHKKAGQGAGCGPGGPPHLNRCQHSHHDLSCDQLLDVRRLPRQRTAEELRSIFDDEHDVLDAYAKILFRDVNSRLDRDDHAGFERRVRVGGVVHLEAHVMTQSVREVLAERLAVQILAVGVDVIVGDLINAVRRRLTDGHAGLDRADGSVLSAQH